MSDTKTEVVKRIYPKAAQVENHARLAGEAFAKHVLTERLSNGMWRSWHCANPECGAYWFNVTTGPGWLLVTGDIGTLVVERCEDMIAWSRSAVNSIDYFAEKVPHEIETEKWDADMVRYWIEEELAECERAIAEEFDDDDCSGMKRWKKRKELLLGLGDPSEKERFTIEFYDSGVNDGNDWPTFTNYTSTFLWCREAVKWLLAHLPEASNG